MGKFWIHGEAGFLGEVINIDVWGQMIVAATQSDK